MAEQLTPAQAQTLVDLVKRRPIRNQRSARVLVRRGLAVEVEPGRFQVTEQGVEFAWHPDGRTPTCNCLRCLAERAMASYRETGP